MTLLIIIIIIVAIIIQSRRRKVLKCRVAVWTRGVGFPPGTIILMFSHTEMLPNLSKNL